MIRLTVRATDDSVPPILLKVMQARLSVGVSTGADSVDHAPSPREEASRVFGNVMVN